ncbi:MAG: hypothetical protein ABSD62_10795 [Candidatus Limnocylindrales bacterium]|jgi:hypothetical protein
MKPEERLADALHATLDPARPLPDLEDRIVERVSIRGRRTVRFNPRFGVAGAAALLLVVVLVPLALSLRSNGGPATGETASDFTSMPTSVPTTSTEATATSAPTEGLAQFHRDGLAFDYPVSWKLNVVEVNEHYILVLDFLGTGLGQVICTAVTPGPSDHFVSGVECPMDFKVDPGQVEIRLEQLVGLADRGPIDPKDAKALASGDEYVTVGGQPAIFRADGRADSASGLTLSWTLWAPENSRFGGTSYLLTAIIKAPGDAQMRAQVEALTASIQYDHYQSPAPTASPS